MTEDRSAAGSELDCREFLAEVYLLLDCECDERRRTELAQHLRECHPCLEAYGIEQELKSLVRRGCSGEKAPEQLRLRLREQIREARFVTTRAVTTTQTYLSGDGSITRRSETSVEISDSGSLER